MGANGSDTHPAPHPTPAPFTPQGRFLSGPLTSLARPKALVLGTPEDSVACHCTGGPARRALRAHS